MTEAPRTAKGELGGRAVELRLISIFDLLAVNDYVNSGGDNMRAGMMMVAAAAFWADTGEKIFADLAAIGAWPAIDMGDISRLASLAQILNQPRAAPDPPPQANGHAREEDSRPSP